MKEDYTREVIALWNNPTESASGWDQVLKNLKSRGLENIDLVVADGIIGLEDKVLAHFPTASFQKCVTHFKRNILCRVRAKDKPLIALELAGLFDISNPSHTKERANQIAHLLIKKWSPKYPVFKNLLGHESLRSYLTCLDFDTKIRSMIYTTNWIERLNAAFRGALKIRNAIPSIDSVLLLLSAIAYDMENNTYIYPISRLSNEPNFLEK